MKQTNTSSNVLLAELSVNAESIAPYAKKMLPPNTGKLLTLQEGVGDVLSEIRKVRENATQGSIAVEVLDQIIASYDRTTHLEDLLTQIQHLEAIITITKSIEENDCQQAILGLAGMTDVGAQRFGARDLATTFAKTREYRSALAKKAVRTRRRNAAAKAKAEQQAGNPQQTPVVSQPAPITQPEPAPVDTAQASA